MIDGDCVMSIVNTSVSVFDALSIGYSRGGGHPIYILSFSMLCTFLFQISTNR